MKSNYSINLDVSWVNDNNIDNYKSFNKLMETFDYSGVFSEKMIEKVFSLANKMIDIKNYVLDNKIIQDDADIKFNDVTNEFKNLLNMYSIFSNKFKSNCLILFISIGL